MLALLNSSEMLHSHSLPGPGGPILYVVLSYPTWCGGRTLIWEKDTSRVLLFTCSALDILTVVLHSFKICAELKEREACYPV